MTREFNEREWALLGVVSEGNGRYDARQVDLVISSRLSPGDRTVFAELESLREAGWLARHDEPGAIGYTWSLTEEGQAALEAGRDSERR